MIIPGFIREGDTLGVTAPSAGASDPLDAVRFGHAREVLEGKGYKIRFTPNTFTDIGDERSSPAEQRARELESLIANPDVRYILSASGGERLNEIFDHLDMSGLADDPKWIQGYSDNTDLLIAATVNYDVMSIYCGNYGDYGMEPWHRSVAENLEFVEGKRNRQESFDMHAEGFTDRITGLEPFECTAPTVWTPDVSFSGRLIGGCLDKLQMMAGGPRDRMRDFSERYRDDGIVWFMETYVSDPEGVTSALDTMSACGWFENVRGFIFGRPLFFEGDYRKAVESSIGGLGVPMVFDADVGHKAPRMTMVNGAYAEIKVNGGKCTITYPELGPKGK